MPYFTVASEKLVRNTVMAPKSPLPEYMAALRSREAQHALADEGVNERLVQILPVEQPSSVVVGLLSSNGRKK